MEVEVVGGGAFLDISPMEGLQLVAFERGGETGGAALFLAIGDGLLLGCCLLAPRTGTFPALFTITSFLILFPVELEEWRVDKYFADWTALPCL